MAPRVVRRRLDADAHAVHQRRRLQPVLRAAPQAGRRRDVARLVVGGEVDRAGAAVDGRLAAEQLARLVVVQLDLEAGGRVACLLYTSDAADE